jgi:hypothetical protein
MLFYLSKEAVAYLEAGMCKPLPSPGSGQCSSGGRLTALMLSSSETHQDFCCWTQLNGHAVVGGMRVFLVLEPDLLTVDWKPDKTSVLHITKKKKKKEKRGWGSEF